ncbi:MULTISPECIES: winged helix-turn-helix domain-containing protein [unclassified Streptomyces]|uniref:helix-turn-helix domain-containing protein n=1 Tax=unclassified Streptomyces TaxID=2593676 RepID=UPI00300E2FD4
MGGPAVDAGAGEDADRAAVPRLLHGGGHVRLLKRHGWSWQQPVRRAIERDDEAVELWKKEVWPRVRAPRRSAAAGSCLRTRPASR